MSTSKIMVLAVVAVLGAAIGGYALLTGLNADDGTGAQEENYPSSVTITQNNGDTVTVQTPVEKVCVVNGNAAEFMQVLNVSDRVVGVSESIATDDEFGTVFAGVEAIGTYNEPNGEKILQLGATVVIGQCTSMAIKDPAALRDMGITVVLLDCYGLNQQCDDLRQLASLFGFEAQERAEHYIEIFDRTVAMVAQSSVEFGPDVTCYMELSNGKAYTSKAEMSSLIDLAGGHNIVVDLVSDPASSTQLLSNEAIIAYGNGSGPAYIMVREGSITDNATAELLYQTLMSRAGWSTLNATLNDNVHIITQSGIMSGPRVYIGLVYLCELFHPGVLDTTAEDLLQEYNQLFDFNIGTMMGYQHISA